MERPNLAKRWMPAIPFLQDRSQSYIPYSQLPSLFAFAYLANTPAMTIRRVVIIYQQHTSYPPDCRKETKLTIARNA